MKSIELTRSGPSKKCVWIPLDSISLVQPYIGFDDKEYGTEVLLVNGKSVQIMEDYVSVIKDIQKLA
jgi:hypothetical protein